MKEPDSRSRIKGCLLGGAVGDVLGAPVEFLSLAEIRARFGPEGITGLEEEYGRRGAITDDTQMTLFTAEGLMRAAQRSRDRGTGDPQSVMWRAYQRWLITQGELPPADLEFRDVRSGWLVEVPELNDRRAPGGTCISALCSQEMGTVERPLNNSKGCGGVIRVAPVGLVGTDPFRQAVEAAALTHGHPSGYLAAGALSLMIHRLMAGTSMREAAGEALRVVESESGGQEVATAMQRALDAISARPKTAETVESLSAGWVAEEALAIALYCAAVADDFRSGVLLAVNHSGDSDSTGSITGQLLGTYLGLQSIPREWVDELEAREVIREVADDMASCFIDGEPLAWDRYPGW